MKLGYKTDDSGHECIGRSITATRIRELEAELFVNINKNVSYPLESSHNKGLHVEVHGKNGELITDFNVNNVTTESELIAAVTDFFNPKDNYVMIASAASGETFHYETEVFNKSAIDNKSYDCWDEDQELLEDNADSVITVFLNDELRWQVR